MDNNKEIRKLFIIILYLFCATSFLIAMISYGKSLRDFLFVDVNDSFMDFFNPVFVSYARNPYTRIDMIYPPICYLFYWMVSLMIPSEYFENAYFVRSSQEGLFVLSVYTVITSIVLYFLLDKLIKKSVYKKYIIFSIFLSAPFLHLYERANIIIWALIFLLLFLLYKDDERKKVREFSYICLGLAFSIKIYPAIFGLLLLKEKRYKDALKCAIYGLFIFILPFGIMGGFDKISIMISALATGAQNTISMLQGLGYKVNYSNTVSMILALINGGLDESFFHIGSIIAFVISFIIFVSTFFVREKWKVSALLCCIMIGLPGFSFQYTVIFMVIPLIQFLNKESFSNIDYLYMVLFAMMFVFVSLVPISFLSVIEGVYPVTATVFLESISIFIIPFVIIINEIYEYLKGKKTNE